MSEKTLDTEIRYYEDGTQATAENLNKPLEDLAKTGQYMSQAQFEKNREDTRREMAGNGFIEFGKHYGSNFNTGNVGWTATKVNEGMWIPNGSEWMDKFKINTIILGNDFTTPITGRRGLSETYNPIINANGSRLNIGKYNDSRIIKMPEAPKLINSNGSLLPDGLKHGDYIYCNTKPNMISNGTFDNLDGWRENENGIMSLEDNKLKIEKLTDGSSPRVTISLGILTTGTYTFNYDEMLTSGGFTPYRFVSTSSSYSGGSSINSGGTSLSNESTFTIYESREYHLVLGLPSGSSVDDWITFSNISIIPKQNIFMKINGGDTDGTEVHRCTNVIGQDTLHREDFVFIESWHEKVSEKDIVYPYGDVQYRGNDKFGITGISDGTFTGADTYSQYGEWESVGSTIGKGYIWSSLSNSDKLKFSSEPENNIYIQEDEIYQVRFRVKTVLGSERQPITWNSEIGGIMSTNRQGIFMDNLYAQFPQGKRTTQHPYIYGNGYAIYWDKSRRMGYLNVGNSYIDGKTITEGGKSNYMGEYYDNYVAIPIALVQKRNKGAFHPVINPKGSAKFTDNKFWYNNDADINTIIDCFTFAENGNYISELSGRPDGLFYDNIDERDIEDLRISARKINDYNKFLEEKTQELINNKLRGVNIQYYPIIKQKTEIYSVDNVNLDNNMSFSGNSSYDGVGMPTFYRKLPTQSIDGTTGNVLIEDTTGKKMMGAGYVGGYYLGYSKHFHQGVTDRLMSLTGPVNVKVFGDQELLKIKENNTTLVCDIIGDPETFPQEWKDNGVFGNILTTGPKGENYLDFSSLSSYIPYSDTGRVGRKITLSRKMKGNNSTSSYSPNIKLALQYNKTNNEFKVMENIGNHEQFGISNTDITASSSCNIGNHLYIAEDNIDDMIYLIYYNTNPIIHESGSSEVEVISKAIRLRNQENDGGSFLVMDCTSKPATCGSSDIQRVNIDNITISANGYPWTYKTGYPEHINFRDRDGYSSDGTVKILPYLTSSSNVAKLNFFYKEMKESVNTDIKQVLADETDTLTILKGEAFRIIGLDNKEFDGKILTHNSGFTDRTFTSDSFDSYNVVNGTVYTNTDISAYQEWEGNIWGDDNLFQTNYNYSGLNDDNGNFVIYGQKSIDLNCFI